MSEVATRVAPGTVVRYQSERENRWCREGIALANQHGILFDTFWMSMGDAHRLSDVELSTIEVLFNTNDYDELGHNDAWRWREYHPETRADIPSQHGLQRRLFVLKGSSPDMGTKIRNARLAVEEAEREARRAQSAVDWRREELARLEHQVGTSPTD